MESTHPILNPNDIIDPTSTPLGEILDPDILKDKIDLIDVHGLTASTRTLLQEALDDPRVQWGGSWLDELDSLLGKTKEEFMADDHRILMEVFRILTVSIILLHTMELARFRFEGEHRSTVVKGVDLFRRKERSPPRRTVPGILYAGGSLGVPRAPRMDLDATMGTLSRQTDQPRTSTPYV